MDRMTAVVTGGTGGIGTAICRRLAVDYQVVACYFKNGRHDEAKSWQLAQKEAGFNIDIVYANIVHFSDCETMAGLVSGRYGHVDVLVNNAGITTDVTLKKMTPQQWQDVMDANLTSVFNVTRNFLPFMIKNNYGRIINIASINGRKGQIGQCNYSSSKAALYGFTKSLALETAKNNITVNSISPGYIETAMLTSVKPEIINDIITAIPVGRLGRPAEIANGVAFLASPDSAFITGTNLDINGGQYM